MSEYSDSDMRGRRCQDFKRRGIERSCAYDVEYRPSQSISELVRRLKGRSSWKLQQEFPELSKRYWGRHFWAIGFGCWSTGNIIDKMVNEYLEHHRKSNNDTDSFIFE